MCILCVWVLLISVWKLVFVLKWGLILKWLIVLYLWLDGDVKMGYKYRLLIFSVVKLFKCVVILGKFLL